MGATRTKRVARRATSLVVGIALCLSGAAVVGSSPAAAAPAAPPPPADWQLVFNEEFTGTAIDESVWDVTEGAGKAVPGIATRDAVRIEPDPDQPSDGTATITTYTLDTNGPAAGGLEHYTGEITSGSLNQPAWSGMQATYGYIEARVKLNNQPGTRSNFFLLSPTWHRSPWGDPVASGPEIDVFEMGDPAAGDVLNTEVNPATPGADGKCDWQTQPLPCDQIAGGNLHWNGFDEDHAGYGNQVPWEGPSPQGNFITYSLLWGPDGYWMYRDGVQTFHSREAITYAPEYFILDQCVGCDPGTPPAQGYGDLASSDNKMTIDYVKVWQRPVSDIPNRTVATNTPISVPFSVTDYFSPSTSATVGVPNRHRPEAVRVSATSSNSNVVSSDAITVTGTEPTTVGSVKNPGFESGGADWTMSGSATTWPTRTHSGGTAARLTQGGGRIEQTITGLQPNTTYAVGGFFNLELGYNDTHTRHPTNAVTPGADGRITWIADTNANGKVDSNEIEAPTETTPAWDLNAEFDIGIVDTDKSQAGDQDLVSTRSRGGWTEAASWWGERSTAWREESLLFTTGNSTDSVTFFVDNRNRTGTNDSDLSFDDLYVHPLVPPNRTVSLRPVDNAAGTTTITLTAWVDANNNGTRNDGGTVKETLGTETFDVTFTKGSTFTNGDFETMPLGTGWDSPDITPAAEVVVENPFQPDRVMELAGPSWQPDLSRRAMGTATQTFKGLQANTDYLLSFDAKGKFFFRVNGYSGSDPCAPAGACDFDSADWAHKDFPFRTNASGVGSVGFADWFPADGVSLIDDVKVTTASATSTPAVVAPLLTALGEVRMPSSSTKAVAFNLPNSNTGTTVTSITSSNPTLIPNRNVAASTLAQKKVLSITPVPDRTGVATLTVKWTQDGAAKPDKTIDVFVSDRDLLDPGFETGTGWLKETLVAPGRNGSANALQVDGTSTVVTQPVSGLPDGTGFMLEGYVDGSVTVKVKSVPDSTRRPPSAFSNEVTATWTGSGFTKNNLQFTTAACTDCDARGGYERERGTPTVFAVPGGQIEVSIVDANPSGVSKVDDLRLVRMPSASPLRELSLAQGNTSMGAFNWDTRTTFNVGRIPANGASAHTDPNPAIVGFTTTDRVPGGTEVLPDASARIRRLNVNREYEWAFETHHGGASGRTGRSDVTMTLTDPGSGLSTRRTATVTVNAGSLDNGDFERGGGRLGWQSQGLPGANNWEIVGKQRWRHLNGSCVSTDAPCPALVGPNDADKVLRISSGIVAYKVSGLTAGQQYVLQANAIGDGSTIRVVANNGWNPFVTPWAYTPAWGTELGRVTVNSHKWAPTDNLFFTPMAPTADPPQKDPNVPELDESEVWILVWDANDGTFVDRSAFPCAKFAAPTQTHPGGETCVDDIGIFKPSDVGL